MKFKLMLLLFIGIATANAQTAKKKSGKTSAAKSASMPAATSDGIYAEIATPKGKIMVRLEYQKAPITVANFVLLAEGTHPSVTDATHKGKPFYDGLKFHRVIKDFMIQGGDPAGNGSGNPGFSFKDEIVPEFKFDKAGILAMANSGPSTNGSQFFITHKETSWLTGKHTIFGFVTSGQDVVNAIAQDDIMNKVTIIRKGADAKKFDALKTWNDYYAHKADDDKKMADQMAEQRKQQEAAAAEAKRVYDEQYGSQKAAKAKELADLRKTATKTASGLEYKITKTGTGKKPADGTTEYIHYAGFLEDGTMFDSSYEDVAKTWGKFDMNRAKQGGYQPFPFQAGKKEGLIPGFTEGLGLLNFGDKATIYIPSALGYGERGAGGVIAPNSNLVFEIEIFETQPAPPPPAAPGTPEIKK